MTARQISKWVRQTIGDVRARQCRACATDGMIVSDVDLSRTFYDPMVGFRELAIAGRLTNGPDRLDDPRSIDTKGL